MSSASTIDIDSDIRKEESNNFVEQYQNLTHCKQDQLSKKIKEYLLITILVRTNYSKTLYNDRLAISKEYKDTYKLKSGVPKLWLKSCYKLVLSFGERATNVNLNYGNKRIYAFTHTVEEIFKKSKYYKSLSNPRKPCYIHFNSFKTSSSDIY